MRVPSVVKPGESPEFQQATGFPVLRFLPIALSVVLAGPHLPVHASGQPSQPAVDYRRQVKTLLSKHCWACHGALKQEAGLRLDAAQLIRKGSDDGPVIVAGRVEQSLLWQKVTAKLPDRMPPEGKPLSAEELATLKAGISQGANSPRTEQPPANPLSHWSFTPIRRPPVPTAKTPDWVRNPIDAFVRGQLDEQPLSPAPHASPRVLARRLQ